MAWTTPVDYSTGQIITSVIWNSLIGSGGNIDETAPAKVTTAGDLVYGTGANAIARLGVGSANQVLKVNSGATAPEWSAVAASELTAANWKLFYSNGSGAVQELALAASGVLTANGTSAAPTFEAPASGGIRSFTADGAIGSAGLIVTENADGTVSTITDTRGGGTQTTLALTAQSAVMPYASTSGYQTTGGSLFQVWAETSDGTNVDIVAAAGTISGSTITWGTQVILNTAEANKMQIAATYDPTNNKVWVMWNTSAAVGGIYKLATFTISGTTITQTGSETSFATHTSSSDQGSCRLVWDSTNNQMIALSLAYGYTTFEIAAVTESGGTITVGSVCSTAVSGGYSMDAVWDSVSDRLVATTTDGLGGAFIHSWSESSAVFTADVTSGSVGTGWTTQAPAMNSSILLNSETANKCTFICEDASGYIASRTFTVAAGSITAVTAKVASSVSIGSTYYQRFGWAWDSTNSKYSLIYIDLFGSVYYQTMTINNATSALTFDDLSVSDEANQSRYVNYRGGYLGSGNSNQILNGARNTSTSKQNSQLATVVGGETTANRFVGISTAAVSDGAAGDFTIIGGVNTDVSGLTAPNNYYIQADGTLALTADSPDFGVVGRALSATSILVTGVGDTTVSSG